MTMMFMLGAAAGGAAVYFGKDYALSAIASIKSIWAKVKAKV